MQFVNQRFNILKPLKLPRVKDSELRQILLKESMSQSLSLVDIKAKVQSLNSKKPEQSTVILRLENAFKVLKKSKALKEPKNVRQLEKIIEQIEKLIK